MPGVEVLPLTRLENPRHLLQFHPSNLQAQRKFKHPHEELQFGLRITIL